MKKPNLWIYASILCLSLTILHFPSAYSTTGNKISKAAFSTVAKTASAAQMLYDQLSLNTLGLSFDAFDYAMKGVESLSHNNKIANGNVVTVIDFTKPSTQKRLFVIDLSNQKVLFNTYVAHGQKSGLKFAETFSNRPESYQSSLGFYRTLGTYNGKHGYSLKLEGVERGINDKAEERAIVMHAADYVSEGFIKSQGYLGRSWGCPAISPALNKPIIDKIKNGSCLFIYSNDRKYLQNSSLINS